MATGLGITANIIDCYAAIIRLYEEGDRIFLIGFSRGAYTVRSLAGVMAYCGIPRQLPGGRLATLHFTRPKHEFYDTTLNVNVGYAKHAISIDENRADFARVKWNPTAEKLNKRDEHKNLYLGEVIARYFDHPTSFYFELTEILKSLLNTSVPSLTTRYDAT